MASSSKIIGDKLSDVLHLKKLHKQGILSLAEFISMSSNINEGASTHRGEEAGNNRRSRHCAGGAPSSRERARLYVLCAAEAGPLSFMRDTHTHTHTHTHTCARIRYKTTM